MDETKRAIQLISAGAIEDYIKLAKVTSYKTGFRDGSVSTLIFEGLVVGCGLSAVGAALLIKLLIKSLKEGQDGSKELSEQLECIENTEK